MRHARHPFCRMTPLILFIIDWLFIVTNANGRDENENRLSSHLLQSVAFVYYIKNNTSVRHQREKSVETGPFTPSHDKCSLFFSLYNIHTLYNTIQRPADCPYMHAAPSAGRER